MLPISTTTIDVVRYQQSTDDNFGPSASSLVAGDQPAVFSAPKGAEVKVGGDKEIIDEVLLTDADDLTFRDTVIDKATGDVYEVVWARYKKGLNLEHTQAGVRKVTGQA